MSKLADDVLFDTRLVERHIRKGLTTRKEYDEYLKRNEDQTDQAEWIDMEALASGSGDGSAAAG